MGVPPDGHLVTGVGWVNPPAPAAPTPGAGAVSTNTAAFVLFFSVPETAPITTALFPTRRQSLANCRR